MPATAPGSTAEPQEIELLLGSPQEIAAAAESAASLVLQAGPSPPLGSLVLKERDTPHNGAWELPWSDIGRRGAGQTDEPAGLDFSPLLQAAAMFVSRQPAALQQAPGLLAPPPASSSAYLSPAMTTGCPNFKASAHAAAAATAVTPHTPSSISNAPTASAGPTSLRIEKAQLTDAEAGAITQLRTLTSLHLATNSTATPLRRPTVSLLLSSLPALRYLHLSYIRDTMGDLAKLLPALPALRSLSLSYAYLGSSGAGEAIIGALVKSHGAVLTELQLYECCVSDGMLQLMMGLRSLQALLVQDEDAPEESTPTNAGLMGISALTCLTRLEIFGEELRLDVNLLQLLGSLPSLTHLAASGLDALSNAMLSDDDLEGFEGMDTGGGGPMGDAEYSCSWLPHLQPPFADPSSYCRPSLQLGDLNGPVAAAPVGGGGGSASASELAAAIGRVGDLARASVSTSSGGDGSSSSSGNVNDGGEVSEEDASESSSGGSSDAMGEVTSAPAPIRCLSAEQQSHHHHGAQSLRDQLLAEQRHQQAAAGLAGGGGCGSPRRIPYSAHLLPQLRSLTLYGPLSLQVHPPPLAMLLPQPSLESVKLSGCASFIILRCVLRQQCLRSLTLSHTPVHDMYPPDCYASAGGGGGSAGSSRRQREDYDFDLEEAEQQFQHHQQQQQQQQQPHFQQLASTSAGGGGGGYSSLAAAGMLSGDARRQQWIASCSAAKQSAMTGAAAVPVPLPPLASILGYNTEVSASFRNLRSLRLKDIQGFTDAHLIDLAIALQPLQLAELKLRQMWAVGDEGLAAIAHYCHRSLRTLKLVVVGSCTQDGVAAAVGGLPLLTLLKLRSCPLLSLEVVDMCHHAHASVVSSSAAAAAVGSALQQQQPLQIKFRPADQEQLGMVNAGPVSSDWDMLG